LRRLATCVSILLVVFSARSAFGQQHLVTFAGGFASTSEPDLTFRGAVAAIDYHVLRRLSVVGTVYRTTANSEGFFSTWSWSDTFVGGGVRFSGRPWPRVEPFAQGLLGALRTAGEERPDPNPPRGFRFVDGSYTETVAAGLTGGGVTFYATPRVGARFGVDLQFLFEDTVPQGRFTAELVVGIGSR
jgi:hypothetical protein